MKGSMDRIVFAGGCPPATIAGTSDVTGPAIDTASAEGVAFACSVGTAAVNNLLKAEQSANGTSGWAELVGQVQPPGDDEIGVLIVRRPTKRFVRAKVERGTSTTVNEGLGMLFGIEKIPDADGILAGFTDVAVTKIDQAAEV